MTNIKSWALLVLAAFFYTLGFPNIFNIYIPFMPIIGTYFLINELLKPSSGKKRVLKILVFNTTVTFLSLYWITKTLQEFGELPFLLAAVINFLYAFIFSPQFWIFLILLNRKSFSEKFINNKDFTPMNTFLLAAFFTTIEYYIPQQFPVFLGHPWIVVSKHLGLAPVFGLPIFSFMSYLLVFEMISLKKTKRFSKFNLVTVLTFIILNPLLTKENISKIKSINVRLVQANISNFLKVDSEKGTYASVDQVLKRYETLSIEPFSFKDSD